MAYVKVNGAYFDQQPSGLAAVNDPSVLRGLLAGKVPAQDITQQQFSQQYNGYGLVATPSPQQVEMARTAVTQGRLLPEQLGSYATATQPRTLPNLDTSQATIPNPVAPVPTLGDDSAYNAFNDKILGLLQQYQKLGTAPFVRQGLDASDLQAGRISAQTPNELIGASPDIQNSVRNASANAVNPTIQGANQSAQTFSEQIRGLGGAIDNAKSFMSDYLTHQESKRAEAQGIVKDTIAMGSESLASLIAQQPDLIKLAGYDLKTLQAYDQALKAKEQRDIQAATAKQGFSLSQGEQRYEYDPKTGEYKQVASVAPKPPGSDAPTPYQLLQIRNQIEDNMRASRPITLMNEMVGFGIPQVIADFNAGKSSSIGDTILMRTLAKVTDPATGVREEEYRTFTDAQGALNRFMVLPESWIGQAKLTDEGRAEMIRQIQDRYQGRVAEYNQLYDYYANQAKNSGVSVPPKLIAVGSGSASGATTGTTSSGLKYNIEN